MPVPLVPVKALAEAKSRLAPQVGPLQRRLLAIAMFEDVIAALQAAGAGAADGSPVLVVAADLPLASAAGLQRVLAAAGAPVAVVPSHDGGGTNVLAWRDPGAFRPSFGPDSAARHLAVPGAVRVDEPGLALDVDTADDLRLVAGRLDPASVTARRLAD